MCVMHETIIATDRTTHELVRIASDGVQTLCMDMLDDPSDVVVDAQLLPA